MNYPTKWSDEVKFAVLQWAKYHKGRRDVFGPREWNEWKKHLKAVRSSKHDYGYVLTFLLMGWELQERESFKPNPYLPKTKNPFFFEMQRKIRNEKAVGRHGTARYRCAIGYDGRSYIKRYL